MAALSWSPKPSMVTVGVDKGVLYLPGQPGVAWDGLVSVKETETEAFDETIYLDGLGYASMPIRTDFTVLVKAFTYPNSFLAYSGYQGIYDNQSRFGRFNFSYRTGDEKTGEIHLVYNAVALPISMDFETMGTSTADLFEWVFQTDTFPSNFLAPTAHVIIDLSLLYPAVATAISNKLYGTSSTDPAMPTLTELLAIFDASAVFVVTDNGNGTATISGSDAAVQQIDSTTYQLSYISVEQLDAVTYRVSSY